ncbi:MAG: MinD/ParA family protein [Desulfovibrio sp.]|jgi:flagellar biosynthesis protein FlhG|nr:MinD/ParA family protein [Desulfovibrio sp.]
MSGTFPLAFSITSGKGGVGKTNISVNLAISLARLGKRVVLLDADLGLANVDVLLGLTPKKNLFDLLHGASLHDILFPTPYGFSILPASSGVSDMLALSTGQKFELLESVSELEDDLDYLITDTGAGIGDNVRYFNLAAQERLLILTPEPTSLTDAYALVKVLKQTHNVEHFKVCVNMTPNEKEAKDIFTRLHNACDHFLSGISLDLAGIIPRDTDVRKAVIEQLPFCVGTPDSGAAKAVSQLARTITEWEVPEHLDGNIKFFWRKLLFRES